MTRVIIGATLSPDGYINDRRGSVQALYPDLAALQATAPMQESIRRN